MEPSNHGRVPGIRIGGAIDGTTVDDEEEEEELEEGEDDDEPGTTAAMVGTTVLGIARLKLDMAKRTNSIG